MKLKAILFLSFFYCSTLSFGQNISSIYSAAIEKAKTEVLNTVDAAKKDAATQILNDETALETMLNDFFKEKFTDSEINQIVAFYSSAAGQKLMQEPVFMDEAAIKVEEWKIQKEIEIQTLDQN